MLKRRSQTLHRLHQERGPVAALAAMAVLMQVLVVSLTLALSPQAMAEGLGILCQPSSLEDGTAPRATHDPANCTCGPICGHSGKIAATGLSDNSPAGLRSDQTIVWTKFDLVAFTNPSLSSASIRAPPFS